MNFVDIKERFNRAHKSTRCTVERAFGILKRQFHCLHGELRLQPGRACRIILACCVLHNIAMERGQRLEYDDECVEAGEEFELALLTPEGARTVQMAEKLLRQKGFEKKNKIAMSHFKR